METQKLNFTKKLLNLYNTNELKSNSENDKFAVTKRNSIEQFVLNSIPTTKNEEWKYTNLGFLNRNNFKIDFDTKSNDDNLNIDFNKLSSQIIEIRLEDTILITFYNGKISDKLSDIKVINDEIILNQLTIDDYFKSNEFYNYLNESKSIESNEVQLKENPFLYLFDCLPSSNYSIEVKKNINKILQIVYIFDENFDENLTLQYLDIKVQKNIEFEFVENYIFNSENVICFNKTNILQDRNSHLKQTKVQSIENNYLFNFETVYQNKDSVFTNNTISLDGNFVRNNLKTVLLEENIESNLNGLTIVKGNNLIDHHTKVDHYSPHCNSNEFYKTILFDESTGIFNGKILVRKDAQKTNAYQSSKNLIISDTAKMNTKPELEIYADDVKCSHGASTGQIDKDALFYLNARGIDTNLAKTMLLYAFAEEVIHKINNDELIENINVILKRKLNYNF